MTTAPTPKLAPTEHPSCGTRAGYSRHWRRGESADQPCRDANAAQSRTATRKLRATEAGREASRAASLASQRRLVALGVTAGTAANRDARDVRRARTAEQADADFLRLRPNGRLCKGCGEILPAEGFQRDWLTADGRRPRCTRCASRHKRLKKLDKLRAVWSAKGLPTDVCAYCGSAPIEHVDHFYPASKGGPDHPDNYVGSCGPCNLNKSATSPWEWLQANYPERLPFFQSIFPKEVAA